MSRSVDTKQLRWHSYELVSTGQIAPTAVEAVTKLAARRIQSNARAAFDGTRHWQKVPRDITWDVDRNGTKITAEIGRERGIGGQSALMHLLEYGSSKSGPIKPSLGPALDANQEPYEKALLAAATVPIAKGIGRMGRFR